MADEQIIVDIKVEDKEINQAAKSIDSLTDSIEELGNRITDARNQNKEFKKQQKELNELYKAGKISTDQYEKGIDGLNTKIKTNNKIVAKSAVELSKQKRERSANIKLLASEAGAYDKLSARLGILRKNAKNVGAQFGVNSKEFIKASGAVSKLNQKLTLIDNELGLNVRTVGKYTNALKGMGNQLLGQLGISSAIGFMSDQFTKARERASELTKSTNRLKGTFDITTSEAKKLANQINAIANNFDDADSKDLEISLTAITKTFKDLSEQDALDLIQEGFQKGSNNSGEFLDILREYPVQFKAAGIDAKTMFAIINQQVEEGIYSDKGVDTIKEGGLRLRENTKAVQEALKPLDDSVKAQIKQEIAAGNSFKAIQLVAEALKDTSLSAEAAQTIIADVFGGAGEDAGIEYIQSLADIETNLDNVAKQTTINEEVNFRLSKSYNAFILSVSDGDGIISRSFANIKEGFASFLEGIEKINSESFGTKMKVMANGVLSVVNAISFGGLDKALKNVTQSEEAWRFNTDKTTGALKLQREEVKENTRSVKVLAKIEKEEVEQQKLADKNRKKRAKATEKESNKIANAAKARIKATESASLKLIKIDNKRRLAATNNAKELRDERLKIESETLVRLLGNEKLFAIEKEAITQQSVQNIVKINADFDKTQEAKLQRKRAANEKIQEINNETAISEIENAEELRDKLIEIEEKKLELKLENENLLKEEREALVLESEQNIKEIQDKFTDEKIEKDAEDWEERKEILEESFNEIVDITRGFAGAEAALFGGISLGIIKAFEDGKLSAVSALNGIALVSDAVFGAMAARRDQESKRNEKARENALISVGDNLEAQDAINKKYDEKAKALKLKQFRADKAKALIDIAIATAVGVARTLPNLVLAGIIGAFGITQGIIVAAKRPPRFATGTNDIVSIGGSHASGNDVDVFGVSGSQKQYFGKVEKGEAMPVIRKNAVNSYLVSKLNGKYSSGGRKFARGTNDITDNQGQGQNNGASAVEIASAIENITIVAKIEDITKQARKKVEIVDNSKV